MISIFSIKKNDFEYFNNHMIEDRGQFWSMKFFFLDFIFDLRQIKSTFRILSTVAWCSPCRGPPKNTKKVGVPFQKNMSIHDPLFSRSNLTEMINFS